jgi:hypothetical protein
MCREAVYVTAEFRVSGDGDGDGDNCNRIATVIAEFNFSAFVT